MKFLYFLIIFFLNQSVYAECISGDCNNGQGTYNKTNGDKYVGEFKKGKRHGNGTYYFNDGSKYIGEFINGLKDGQGTYNKTNGDKYVGEFKKGKRHGNGTYYFNDGEVKKGIWENQKLIKSN